MNPSPIPVPFRVFSVKSPFFLAFPLLMGALLLLGCEDTQPRTYNEVAFKPLVTPGMSGPRKGGADGGMGDPEAMGGMGGMGGVNAPINSSPVDIKVTWTLPDTWMVKDSANAMRIGSFAAMDAALAHTGEMDPNAVDVSVVQLAGAAGGLAANIQRWNGQIGIKMSAEEMEEFLKAAQHFKTASGQDGIYVDLTDKLSGDMTQSKTIFGGVVQTEEYTVFVKAMGDQAKVAGQKPLVIDFCKSLKIAGPKS